LKTDGQDRPPATEATEPATAYHETVTDLRRTLVKAAEEWHKTNEHYFGLMHAQPPSETPAEIRDAYAGSLMAAGYAYTLAAILGVAERKFGPEVAKRLAFDTDEILTNGDFDDLNADVMPGPAESNSTSETSASLSDAEAMAAIAEEERNLGSDGGITIVNKPDEEG
jgi:hypothetical protein